MKFIKKELILLNVILLFCIGFVIYQATFKHVVKNEYIIKNDIPIEEIFKNEYIYIGEENDSNCHDYSNNINYYENELMKTFVNSKEVTSFLYYDINSGYTYSYNENVDMATASSIKAALAIYIYDQVSHKKADLDEKLTYTSDFYNGGSGVIKNHAVGSKYTIKQLVEYSIINSDNIAYLMLLDKFDYQKVQKYWLDLGTKSTYKSSTKWGNMTAKDGLIYMKRLYEFYMEDEKYGSELMDIFKRALFRFIDGPSLDKIEVGHKSGFMANAANDVAIVFDKNPYIYIVLTRKDGQISHDSFFEKVTEDAYKLHRYYWDNINCKY